MEKIGIIGVPSSAGARKTGQERAAHAFRQASLVERLQDAGLSVTDFGDLDEVVFTPDQENPKAQNLDLVVDVSAQVADRVETVFQKDHLPLVLGGDCSIIFGVTSGLIRQTPNLGLMYFDGDIDLNTPDTTTSGVFDGMVMAHMIGRGVDAYARSGPRYPLMNEEDIVLFAYNTESGWIDEVEAEVLAQSRMITYPLSGIQGRFRESAEEALSQLEARADSILVHFDVDVIDDADFPAADVGHPKGARFSDAMAALTVFAGSQKLAGVVIAEFNVERDPDGKLAQRLVDGVSKALQK